MSNTNSIKSVEILETTKTPVKWYWWIMWLLIFWPMLFVLYFYQTFSSDKVYQVGVIYPDNSKKVLTVDQQQLNTLKVEAFEYKDK